MNDQSSLGFVETAGLSTAIIVADAMVKAAEVTILAAHKVDGQNVCVVCAGDVASCKAAVDVGVAVASERGRLLACNVIPRPADGDISVIDLLRGIVAKKAIRKAEKLARRKALASEACGCAESVCPVKAPAAAAPVAPAAPVVPAAPAVPAAPVVPAAPAYTAPKPSNNDGKNGSDNDGKKHKK